MNSKIDLNEFFKKHFPKKNQWLIILLVGILLVVIALPTSNDKETEKTTASETEVTEIYTDDYADKMERKVAKILQNIEGVGNVKVMITLKESTEKVVEKDVESSRSESGQDVDISSGESTVYSDTGSSGQEPYVSKEISPAVEGVLVIADGGDNSVIVKNITEAIQALFNVETHKIKVMKSK